MYPLFIPLEIGSVIMVNEKEKVGEFKKIVGDMVEEKIKDMGILDLIKKKEEIKEKEEIPSEQKDKRYSVIKDFFKKGD